MIHTKSDNTRLVTLCDRFQDFTDHRGRAKTIDLRLNHGMHRDPADLHS